MQANFSDEMVFGERPDTVSKKRTCRNSNAMPDLFLEVLGWSNYSSSFNAEMKFHWKQKRMKKKNIYIYISAIQPI
jgi:hypothetical protein